MWKILLSVFHLVQSLRLILRLLFDRRVPFYLKLLPAAAVTYLVSPIDLVPDIILLLGRLDDILVILLASVLFLSLAPRDVVREHLGKMRGTPTYARQDKPAGDSKGRVIKGSYRFVDDRKES